MPSSSSSSRRKATTMEGAAGYAPADAQGGVMMILSPAKTLDLHRFERPSPSFPPLTEISCDADRTRLVAAAMKARDEKGLAKLLGISPKLAEASSKYWGDFELDRKKIDEANQKPAIYAFSGAAYQGLQISSCAEDAIRYMQKNLRIVDPLYGALRPLDLMQPYRLEMATKGVLSKKEMGDAKTLAGWWKSSVSASISSDLDRRDAKILVNLASDEYSAAVDPTLLPEGTRYVKVVFQQEGRVIAVHAKRARGLMVRFLAENAISDDDGIKRFADEGYRFVESKSTESSFFFDRPKQPAAAAAKKKSSREADSSEKAARPLGKKARTSRKLK